MDGLKAFWKEIETAMTSQVSETTEALVEPGKQESMSPPDHFELERPPQKIALLFLSLGELHNEPVWRAFFEVAGRPQNYIPLLRRFVRTIVVPFPTSRSPFCELCS